MSEGHELLAQDETTTQVTVEETDLDVIVPNKEHRTWTFGTGDLTLTYTQKPLSFQGKLEFLGLLGVTVNRAMSGPDGLTISGLLAEMDPAQKSRLTQFQLDESDFASADTFIQGISTILTYVPDFLLDAQCIWLGVPKGERALVKDVMSQPSDEGGLSDEEGIEMIQTFLDQNVQDLVKFMRKDLPKLGKRGTKLYQLAASPSSKH